MKRKIQLAVLVLGSALALSACGGEPKKTPVNKAESAASSAASSAVSEAADDDEAGVISEEELFYAESSAEDGIAEEEADYFAEEDYQTESEKLVSDTMENPFGEPVEVSVWEGIEMVPDTDGANYSTLSSYANNISLGYQILKDDCDSVEFLKESVKQAATMNMTYVNMDVESPVSTEDGASCTISFSGKGSTPFTTMYSLSKLSEGVWLKSEATWYRGTDMYGIDYTPDEKYIAMVKDAFGMTEGSGTPVELSPEDTEPDAKLHEFEISDERVGRKSFYVWEEDPYVMTAAEMDDSWYGDDDYEFVFSEIDSFPEEIADEDDYDFDMTDVTGSEAESYDENADFNWDEAWTESDAEWSESGAEWYDDGAYEDEDEGFVAYCSTGAKGVFVNAEMYLKPETGTMDDLMNEYIENLAYMGANSIKRSEVKTSDNAEWVTVQYGEEAEDAYTDLVLIHAFVWDDTVYTKMDIYFPTDADEKYLNEFMEAYGIDRQEASTEVEQMEFDYGFEDEMTDENGEAYSDVEFAVIGDEEVNAVG